MYSSLDTLNINLKQNKDGTYNIRDLQRYQQAEFVKSQIKYFDEWDKVYLHHYIKCHYNSDGSIEGSLIVDIQKQKRKTIYQKINRKLGNR